jgi:hypothetical protein
MPDSSLLTLLLFGVLGLFGIGLVYFVFVGVRAIYREAWRTAREAGHREASASARAVLRMGVWALYFGAFYFFIYFLGRRIGWWAIIPAAAGLAAMVWALLQADRLLTIRSDDVRQQLGIGASLTGLIAIFGSIIWFAAHGG